MHYFIKETNEKLFLVLPFAHQQSNVNDKEFDLEVPFQQPSRMQANTKHGIWNNNSFIRLIWKILQMINMHWTEAK